jgi:hypothetical protein
MNSKYEKEKREIRSPSYTKYSTPTRYTSPAPVAKPVAAKSLNLIARLDPPAPSKLNNYVPPVKAVQPIDKETIYVSKPRDIPKRQRTPPLTPQPPPPTPVIETPRVLTQVKQPNQIVESAKLEPKDAEKKVLAKEVASTIMKPDLKMTEAIKIETPPPPPPPPPVLPKTVQKVAEKTQVKVEAKPAKLEEKKEATKPPSAAAKQTNSSSSSSSLSSSSSSSSSSSENSNRYL